MTDLVKLEAGSIPRVSLILDSAVPSRSKVGAEGFAVAEVSVPAASEFQCVLEMRHSSDVTTVSPPQPSCEPLHVSSTVMHWPSLV